LLTILKTSSIHQRSILRVQLKFKIPPGLVMRPLATGLPCHISDSFKSLPAAEASPYAFAVGIRDGGVAVALHRHGIAERRQLLYPFAPFRQWFI
jgi:hypothetical protein